MIALRAPAFLPRIVQWLATIAAMAVFAWIAGHWIWRALAPAPPPPVISALSDGGWAARITGGGAFGFAPGDPAPAQADAAQLAQIDARIRLLGLSREEGARGRKESQALFKIDQRILWLKPGDELDPGVRLAAIDPDGVRLSANGREVRLPLRADKAVSRPGVAPAIPGVVAPAPLGMVAPAPQVARVGGATDACKLPPDRRSRAYVLRPEIVDSVMRERAGWADLFKATANGIVVQNPGGTGAMLGLYANDLLAKADGAQLSSADDVLRLVLQPLARNESVIVTGSRAGQPREWIYAGMNCLNR